MKLINKIICNVLGWHEPSDEVGFDGWNVISKCKCCGRKIMRGENSNWYRID